MFNNFVVKKFLPLLLCAAFIAQHKTIILLWRIENPSAKTVSYLFRNHTCASKKFMNLRLSVYKAMSAAKGFIPWF